MPVLELLCPAGAQAPSGQRSVCLGFTASLMLKECQARVRARHARVSVRGECYTLVAWLREVCSVHFFILQIFLSMCRVISIMLFLQIQQ